MTINLVLSLLALLTGVRTDAGNAWDPDGAGKDFGSAWDPNG
jgi:hypothetical protein